MKIKDLKVGDKVRINTDYTIEKMEDNPTSCLPLLVAESLTEISGNEGLFWIGSEITLESDIPDWLEVVDNAMSDEEVYRKYNISCSGGVKDVVQAVRDDNCTMKLSRDQETCSVYWGKSSKPKVKITHKNLDRFILALLKYRELHTQDK